MRFDRDCALTLEDALRLLPTHGQVGAGYLRGLKELLRSLGADPGLALEQHDIDPLRFGSPDYHIECAAAVNLLEHCSHVLQDPLFGAHLAEYQEPDVLGCVTALLRAAPTVGHALRGLVNYLPMIVFPNGELELVSCGNWVELHWRSHFDLRASEQANLHALMLLVKMLRLLGREQFRPCQVSLRFALARPVRETLQERVGCKVKERSQSNVIAFGSKLLERAVASSNGLLYNLLGSYLEQLSAAARGGFVERLEACVRRSFARGDCSLERCAQELGTSGRALQRRLTREGLSFSQIVQNERIKLAKQSLRWSDCTLDEIAVQLGYAEQTSFGRAFKRSTGVTPHTFRSTKSLGSSGNRLLPLHWQSIDDKASITDDSLQRLSGT